MMLEYKMNEAYTPHKCIIIELINISLLATNSYSI